MKDTFAAKTFASKTFASGNWAGVGTAIPPSTDIDGNLSWEDDRRPFVNDDNFDAARTRLKEAY